MANGGSEMLMGIPNEMWGKIIKCGRLDSRDMVNFRSVNKKCKDLSEALFDGWIITLDDRFEFDSEKGPYLENLLNLRLKELRVDCLLKPLPFRSPGVILNYPSLLKVLRFVFEMKKVRISAENLHVLLKSNNLQILDLLLYDVDLNGLDFSSQFPINGYDFLNLEEFNLHFCHEEHRRLQLLSGNLFDRIIKYSTFSKLRSVEVRFDISGNGTVVDAYRLSCDVLEFIVKHGNTLRLVKFLNFCGPSRADRFPALLETVSETRLEKCSKLMLLNVYCRFSNENWRLLLKQQTNLAELETQNIDLSLILFQTVIDKNYHTLHSINVWKLELSSHQFDFLMLLNCHSLKRLNLNITFNGNHEPEGKNLLILNPKLEHLSLHFLLPSADLLLFCFSHIHLKSLTLTGSGSFGLFGINGSIFEKCLALPKLTELCIDQKSINNSVSAEAAKFVGISETLGFNFYLKQNVYLIKDSSNNCWLRR